MKVYHTSVIQSTTSQPFGKDIVQAWLMIREPSYRSMCIFAGCWSFLEMLWSRRMRAFIENCCTILNGSNTPTIKTIQWVKEPFIIEPVISPSFWVQIRCAWFRSVTNVLLHVPKPMLTSESDAKKDKTLLDRIASTVFVNLDAKDPLVSVAAWDATIALMSHFEVRLILYAPLKLSIPFNFRSGSS